MKPLTYILLIALALTAAASSQTGRAAATSSNPAPMVLTGTIPLPGVQGRIDHMSIDPHNGLLFVSALGNDSEEVVDLSAGIRVHTITGIPRPQGVIYAPEANKLFVASDEGKLYIYDGASYALLATLDFGDDVDNLRYDAAAKRLYAAYGDGEQGAIAMIDVTNNKRLPVEFKLGAHPESFQLEAAGTHLYVNLPDLKQIAAVDRKTGDIVRWPVTADSNFPMALDEARHRLFVATRGPAQMQVYDTSTGLLLAALPCVQASDDLYFDAARRRIYVSGGEGYISVFQQKEANSYSPIAKVPSALGGRTAGYFGKGHKGFDVFYLAVPARIDRGAEILVYTVQD